MIRILVFFLITVLLCNGGFLLAKDGYSDLIALDEQAPEVKFARQVETAIMDGRDAFDALLLHEVDNERMEFLTQWGYSVVRARLDQGAEMTGVVALEEEGPQKYGTQVYRIEWEGAAVDGGVIEYTMSIGKINGEWKIINEDILND